MRSKLIQAGVCTGMVLSVLGQSSADYRLEHATTDLGAGRQSSATYSVHSSLGGFGGTASAGNETVRTGFAGQLNEPPQAGADGLAGSQGRWRRFLFRTCSETTATWKRIQLRLRVLAL